MLRAWFPISVVNNLEKCEIDDVRKITPIFFEKFITDSANRKKREPKAQFCQDIIKQEAI